MYTSEQINCFRNQYCKLENLPSSYQSGGCGFSPALQNDRESDLGHISNLFYTLCGHFYENELVIPPYLGVGKAVRVKGLEGGCNLFFFLSRYLEKYLHTMKLKLTGHVYIFLFLLRKQKPG